MSEALKASPISPLWHSFADAPFALAPERGEELHRLIQERNIQFKLDDETQQVRFDGVDLFGGLGLVCVGLRGLERLWIHAYAATHIYFRFQATGFSEPLVLPGTAEGRIVAELLEWALRGEMHGDESPWPEHLPRPQAKPADDQNQVTNELFLGAGGFAVLHELGHIARAHRGSDLPRDVFYRQEFEADEWAYDWVMDRWRDFDPRELVFKKRATLIAALFGLITVNQVYRPRRISVSVHPNTIDRLMRFLTKHANEDSGLQVGLPWAVAGTTIHLHLSQRLKDTLPPFNSWRTYFHVIRDTIDQP